MKNFFLVNYSVKGIKTLDDLVTLSFYKKTISKELDTQEYNLKGIYGMNGSGKSAIVTSVDILKNILVNPGYLNNPIVQKNLEAIINKRLGELYIEADFIVNLTEPIMYFRYKLVLSKDVVGKYQISYEQLSCKKATSKTETMEVVFEVKDGAAVSLWSKEDSGFSDLMVKKTTNLLSNMSMCAVFFEKILVLEAKSQVGEYQYFENQLFSSLIILFLFADILHVYIDQSDDHRDYFVRDSLKYTEEREYSNADLKTLVGHSVDMDAERLDVLTITENYVPKRKFEHFKQTVDDLFEFLSIFKSDLTAVEIDRKEDRDSYICNLVMVYDSYRIHAEFESTGIKKLIKLYAYLREMVQGGIVFIDEFDSNLHDVYLCALLEYLMEYGKGQLCFTTHNVGPMDILRRQKKSIDFLSIDGKIYPWTRNGNYSPSKLYRNGMIEGSPFNVDSIDFIGIFGAGEGDCE